MITPNKLDDAADWYVSGRIATAHKTDRSADFSCVAVIINRQEGRRDIVTPIRGYVFKTRSEAVEYAAAYIVKMRNDVRTRLTDPREQALRMWCGLRRELDPARASLVGSICAGVTLG